jgi:hypothetical protein
LGIQSYSSEVKFQAWKRQSSKTKSIYAIGNYKIKSHSAYSEIQSFHATWSTIINNSFSWWSFIKTSPLLELYARAYYALQNLFVLVLQKDICLIKCQEINLSLKRNMFKKHDFAVYIKNLKDGCLLIMSLILCIVLIYHIVAFQIASLLAYFLAWYFVKTLYLPFKGLSFLYYNIKTVVCKFSFNTKKSRSKLIKCFSKPIGGGISNIFILNELSPYINMGSSFDVDVKFKFVNHILQTTAYELQKTNPFLLVCNLPLLDLASKLVISDLKNISKSHNIAIYSKMKREDIQNEIKNHSCNNCQNFVSVFEIVDELAKEKKAKEKNIEAVKRYQAKNSEKYKAANLEAVQKHQAKNPEKYKTAHLEAVQKNQCKDSEKYKEAHLKAVQKNQCKNPEKFKTDNLKAVQKYQGKDSEKYKIANLEAVQKYQEKNSDKIKKANLEAVHQYQKKKAMAFPPLPPSEKLQHTIISDFCNNTAPNKFIESGCAVCGRLTLLTELQKLSDLNLDLSILIQSDITQQERHFIKDPITEIEGPVLDKDLDMICKTCHKSVSKGKVPLMALANGKWLGEVPPQLANLSFAEQLLVARIRHNRCLIRVSSGMRKMRANAIMFENPMPKIYDVLPPSMDEMDDVLAFIYTGPCKPTKDDFKRTPLLVRRKKVSAALEWLKLNHCDYYDLEISYRNLSQYPEDGPPVVVDYHKSTTNKDPESTAVNDIETEDGTETGLCPFVVHGLTGEEFSTKSLKAIKAIALKHLTSSGKILAIGHEKDPQSIYKNPQLFPQMMPWLFPYGLGGIGNTIQQGRLSDMAHKRHLLMYHDKRFQKDPHFPLIAFNHEQIKESTTAGYLLAEKPKFDNISKRLMDVDIEVLTDLIQRMENEERVKPETDEEKLCFQLIKDLDHVGGQVKGSITSKKYMRNEIWSLISFVGAPSWFITFAPADNMHPISLYFADTKETFSPHLREYDERYRLIANNPVAGARFFDFICKMFIKHVLGVGEDHPGFLEIQMHTMEQ